MRIYHASKYIIEKPEYGKGKKNNDYGQGFYCTEDIDLAREWAVDKDRDGYVNSYDIESSSFKILRLNSPDFCVLHWITILLNNRRFELESPVSREAFKYLSQNFMPDLTGVDIIIGYRADDSYFSFAQDFVNGVISVSQLNKAMHMGNLGEQIFIRSRKAFSVIRYLGSERVSASEWYDRKKVREHFARKEYGRLNKEVYVKGELYMIRILDEEVRPDDPRLQ